MDKIIIQGLEVKSLIGVYDWERLDKQSLVLDLELHVNLAKAAHSDDVADTIDYAQLADVLTKVAEQSEYQLLEALADKMIQSIFSQYQATRVVLRLTKPEILHNAKQVSVELSREAK